jgi:hypothetical protein
LILQHNCTQIKKELKVTNSKNTSYCY